MWLLSPFHPIRRIAIRVLVHPIFSLIVILTILANCYVMILPDSEYTNATEIVFTALYTYESAVKVRYFLYFLTGSTISLFECRATSNNILISVLGYLVYNIIRPQKSYLL